MKRQAYERAVEINERVNYLEDLINLLLNATSMNCRLAAQKRIQTYGEDTNEIVNAEKLDTGIRDKFIEILRDEQKKLRDEFDNL